MSSEATIAAAAVTKTPREAAFDVLCQEINAAMRNPDAISMMAISLDPTSPPKFENCADCFEWLKKKQMLSPFFTSFLRQLMEWFWMGAFAARIGAYQSQFPDIGGEHVRYVETHYLNQSQ